MTKSKEASHKVASHDEWLKQRKELPKKEKEFTEEQQRKGAIKYNYREGHASSRKNEIDLNATVPEAGVKITASTGTDGATYTRDAPGMSALVLKHGWFYHTYSAFERG